MKPRMFILTASAFLALAGAAHPAGAMIPRDEGLDQTVERSAQSGLQPAVTLKKSTTSTTAIHTGAFAPWAYVQGGRSGAVGKAVTAAGKKLAHSHAKVRVVTKIKKVKVRIPVYVTAPATQNGESSAAGYCQTYPADCTNVQFCEYWGVACYPAPPAPVVPAEEAAATDAVATDAAAAGQTPLSLESGEPSTETASTQPGNPTSERSEDC